MLAASARTSVSLTSFERSAKSPPALTEETRKEIVKKAHAVAENGRVAVRNVRRHSNDEVKKLESDGQIAEDERKRCLDRIQEKTDHHIERIGELTARKEKEITSV